MYQKMSSERFENLEDDFISSKNEIFQKLENLQKSSGETKKCLLRDIERKMDEAQSLLKELEAEVRIAPNPYRQQMNQKIKQYRQDLDQSNKKLNLIVNSSTREELFGQKMQTGTDCVNNSEFGERSRVLKINETVKRTTDGLNRTQQIAAETDMVGIGVMDELETQRESLVRTRQRLEDVDENVSRSRRILKSMYRRVITDKLILVIIILLEIAILGGVVYFKFFRK